MTMIAPPVRATVLALLLACTLVGFSAEPLLRGYREAPAKELSAGPFEMRGFGLVEAKGGRWASGVSLVRFTCEDAAKARIVASKYLADLTAYAASRPAADPRISGAVLEIADSGLWAVGVKEREVFVLSGPTRDSLTPFVTALNAKSWAGPELGAHPRYLDGFDNLALGMWWMPPTKSPEVRDFAREHIPVVNVHPHSSGLTASFAPNAYDLSTAENIVAGAREIGAPYRFMIWGGVPPWWGRSVGDLADHVETAPEAALPARDLPSADGYYATQIASDAAKAIELHGLRTVMNHFKDDPNLIGWMEPHGEFFLSEPRRVPPQAETRFPLYLRTVKNYSLEQANRLFGIDAKSWETFPYPEHAYFFGRRGEVIDLDARPWRWLPGVNAEAGDQRGFTRPGFDDSTWASDLRTSRRVHNQFRAEGDTAPLWFRFNEEVPADFLKGDRTIYLHVQPFTEKEGRPVELWVNGRRAGGSATNNPRHHLNKHTQFDVTGLLRPGANHFALYSHGGRIIYRTFLSKEHGEEFPFASRELNQFWVDWNDYLIWEKLEMLRIYLQFMREIDPVRPIKVMTPHMFQAAAMDLFEQYGAYPQLTGQGAFFRPMHYKGYSRLRGIPGSSEGGQPSANANRIQHKFATLFWEGQDAHDYVFDVERDFWSRKDVVQWWKDNASLLKTFGKVDFVAPSVGVLRDVEQGERFMNHDIWRWDPSRGPLPRAGLSPVLVDGPDMDKGLADAVPVIIDCSTSVVSEERVAAIKRYVRGGGVFVAQFNTGRHSPVEQNSWPLAEAFGLRIEDYRIDGSDFSRSPTAKMTFAQEQTLLPSLRGRTVEGSGVAIDFQGQASSGAIRIEGAPAQLNSIAKWTDGGTAIAEIAYGKGRLIWLGSPLHLRVKDEGGSFVNEEGRQALFEEMLVSLGVSLEARSDNPQIWVDKRESKNGLYDVFLASAFGVDRNLDLETRFTANLTLRGTTGTAVADFAGGFDQTVPAERGAEGEFILRDQSFGPFQIRQFAVMRKDAGLRAPFVWLERQSKTWRALRLEPSGLGDTYPLMRQEAQALGQDGRDLSDGWLVRRSTNPRPIADGWEKPGFTATGWEKARLGTWLARGWTDTRSAQYLRRVEVPAEWLQSNKRVLLGFKAGFHQMGVRGGSGKVWINGRLADVPLANPMIVDVSEAAAQGPLDLALEVTGEPREGGPGGLLYLWAVPRPVEVLDLAGSWTNALSWHEQKGRSELPGQVKGMFGLRRTFELPKHWEGRTVRIVVEQDERSPQVGAVMLNQTGYFREARDQLAGYGVRVDHWLKTGVNEIDLYHPRHGSYQDYFKKGIPKMDGEIRGVRLELY